jgi:hypothetical protein
MTRNEWCGTLLQWLDPKGSADVESANEFVAKQAEIRMKKAPKNPWTWQSLDRIFQRSEQSEERDELRADYEPSEKELEAYYRRVAKEEQGT